MPPIGHVHTTRRPPRGERGASLIIMTLTIASLLVVSSLVIDGSQAYPQRRKTQNAVDEAALAATRALDQYRIAGVEGTSGADVVSTARSVVEENDVELESCTVVDGRGNPLGSCTSADAIDHPMAVGVSVEGTDTRPSSFGGLTSQDEVTARASSSATSQPLSMTGSPFIICGNPDPALDSPPGIDILKTDAAGKIIYTDGSAEIDVAKARALKPFPIQGEGGSKTPKCGADAEFKGKKPAGQVSVATPNMIDAVNGNGFEHDSYAAIVGATPCPTTGEVLNCDILLPIADRGTGLKMNIVAWGVFRVTGNGKGNPRYTATFVGVPTYIAGGETTDEVPTSQTPRVIRLIE